MFAGHFALAAGVKAREPRVPLWSLMVATQLMDIVFVPLYMAGIETIVPVGAGGYGGGIIHANYTHSLVGSLLLAAIAWTFGRWRYGPRGGWVLGAVTFSHWVLDLLVHRMDLPWLPGNWGGFPTLGLGLWRYPALTASLELALIVVGTAMYGWSLRGVGKRGPWAKGVVTGLMGLFLVAALASDWFGIG